MAKVEFKDHFSSHAEAYAKYRPKSPKVLFDYLVTLVEQRNTAWDVGTGNGQSAMELVNFFEKVIATDASSEQIQNAASHPKIRYEVSRAEDSRLPHASIDLINIAQAIHWFDFDAFYKEVRRVGKKGGVIAAWSYTVPLITPDLDPSVRKYYGISLEKYWPRERAMVDDGYAGIPFPFEEIKAPTFSLVENRNFEEWCGYVYTWSATQRAIKDLGPSVFTQFTEKLSSIWGDPKKTMKVTWPIGLRLGRI